MMITKIEQHNQRKSKVYINYEFAFVLYKGELRKYKITEGSDISQALYREIVESILLKRAKLRAMNLLTKRPYTEKGLRDKLSEGLYPPECIEGALSYVKSFGYIDDKAYANDYIAYHVEHKSKREIQQKLLRKGIDASLIQDCLDGLTEDELKKAEEQQIQKLFMKKYKGLVPNDSAEKKKMLNYFLRKGYTQATVTRLIAEIDLEDLYNFD